jgi:hypothetical protein
MARAVQKPVPMAVIESILARAGYVKLSRYGMMLTPDGRIVDLHAMTSDVAFAAPVPGPTVAPIAQPTPPPPLPAPRLAAPVAPVAPSGASIRQHASVIIAADVLPDDGDDNLLLTTVGVVWVCASPPPRPERQGAGAGDPRCWHHGRAPPHRPPPATSARLGAAPSAPPVARAHAAPIARPARRSPARRGACGSDAPRRQRCSRAARAPDRRAPARAPPAPPLPPPPSRRRRCQSAAAAAARRAAAAAPVRGRSCQPRSPPQKLPPADRNDDTSRSRPAPIWRRA